MLSVTYIEATSISDAWFQCVYAIQDKGFKYTVEQGSFEGSTRLEFDFVVVQITHPYSEPYNLMLPTIPTHYGIPNPVANGYVEQYLPYLMSNIKHENETYTYGSRITNQVEYFIKRMKKDGFNSNQYVLQVGKPSDAWLPDPPCLRHIDLRVKKNKLIFYPYFRSWDLWSGFPANLAAIAVLQKYMADELEVELGELIAISKGLHIYGYAEELAKIRCNK